MPDVITSANFGMENFRGLRYTGEWGQSLGYPIETSGHPYNSAALLQSLGLTLRDTSHATLIKKLSN